MTSTMEMTTEHHQSPNKPNDLQDRLRRKISQALNDYDMLQDNDKVMVACSGGKDSSLLLYLLNEIKKRAPISFSIEPVILDQKQPGFLVDQFRDWVSSLGLELKILEEDTYSIVKEKVPEGKTYCSLCSRLRRGILYNYAHANGFTKIALGHHADDLIETALLNQVYAGKLASMPPKLLSDDKRNIVIRPLCYIYERDIVNAVEDLAPPIIPCNLCGSQENLQRKKIKKLLNELTLDNPNVKPSLLNALSNVRSSQLLDRNLVDFSFSFSRL